MMTRRLVIFCGGLRPPRRVCSTRENLFNPMSTNARAFAPALDYYSWSYTWSCALHKRCSRHSGGVQRMHNTCECILEAHFRSRHQENRNAVKRREQKLSGEEVEKSSGWFRTIITKRLRSQPREISLSRDAGYNM